MADKGYISTNDYYYNNNKIKLLTYKKRNQVQNEEEIENELKERIFVENKAQISYLGIMDNKIL